jgi:hypothetical protein
MSAFNCKCLPIQVDLSTKEHLFGKDRISGFWFHNMPRGGGESFVLAPCSADITLIAMLATLVAMRPRGTLQGC